MLAEATIKDFSFDKFGNPIAKWAILIDDEVVASSTRREWAGYSGMFDDSVISWFNNNGYDYSRLSTVGDRMHNVVEVMYSLTEKKNAKARH